jgi:hypothetical protein
VPVANNSQRNSELKEFPHIADRKVIRTSESIIQGSFVFLKTGPRREAGRSSDETPEMARCGPCAAIRQALSSPLDRSGRRRKSLTIVRQDLVAQNRGPIRNWALFLMRTLGSPISVWTERFWTQSRLSNGQSLKTCLSSLFISFLSFRLASSAHVSLMTAVTMRSQKQFDNDRPVLVGSVRRVCLPTVPCSVSRCEDNSVRAREVFDNVSDAHEIWEVNAIVFQKSELNWKPSQRSSALAFNSTPSPFLVSRDQFLPEQGNQLRKVSRMNSIPWSLNGSENRIVQGTSRNTYSSESIEEEM